MTIERDEHLGKFQAELLDFLANQSSLDEIRSRLTSDEAFQEYQEYVSTFEPQMVEVAASLVKKWSVRKS
jgi:hypothetical protein